MIDKKKLIIRDATEKDVDVFLDLLIKLAKNHNQLAYVKTTRDDILKAAFNNSSRFNVLLIEYNQVAVGYLSYTLNYSIWFAQDFMMIDDLFIEPDYRSIGLGEKLMQAAKNICRKNNIDLIKWEVESTNLKAITFYERLGSTMKTKGIFSWKI